MRDNADIIPMHILKCSSRADNFAENFARRGGLELFLQEGGAEFEDTPLHTWALLWQHYSTKRRYVKYL